MDLNKRTQITLVATICFYFLDSVDTKAEDDMDNLMKYSAIEFTDHAKVLEDGNTKEHHRVLSTCSASIYHQDTLDEREENIDFIA